MLVFTSAKGAEKALIGPGVSIHPQGPAIDLTRVPIVGEEVMHVVEGGGGRHESSLDMLISWDFSATAQLLL